MSRIAEFLARGPKRIHIAINGVWSADMRDRGTCFSCEKLDYHVGCREFLQGLKDAGIPFKVHGDVGREFASA